MASGEACGCDETLRLRAEVARLTGVIEGMRQGLTMLGVLPRVPDLVPGKPARCEDWCDGCRKERHGLSAPHTSANVRRCAARSRDPGWTAIEVCELPAGHAGDHRRGAIGWP